MGINEKYFRYLEHFRTTTTVEQLSKSNDSNNVIALRHDIDHSIDVALEMAFWESQGGFRATYYLLPTASYWDDPRLVEKALQIQDFGHEVGLHANAIASWVSGAADDVAQNLRTDLDRLRTGGVRIVGVSAHGDRLCYSHGFSNYWAFRELRPADPVSTESGLSAEGVRTTDAEFRLRYPVDHRIVRPDGSSFELWSVAMSDLGLDYDAMHVATDGYFTDSGGSWTRSVDPLTVDLSRGRHQVLFHPIHWRSLPKTYLFLSTARSGSLWLSRFLDDATSVHSEHEFMLNHEHVDNKLIRHKRTYTDFSDLQANKSKAKELLISSRDYIDNQESDWAEVNIYLAHFLDELDEVFPDAQVIHLHRAPEDVVRSLINRDWYDTPDDRMHPLVDVPGWQEMSQFERACSYVAWVNNRISQRTGVRIQFEQMVENLDYLTEVLKEIGVAVYPRFARNHMGRKENVNRRSEFPPRDQWNPSDQSAFASICGEVRMMLGYGPSAGPNGERKVVPSARRAETETTILEIGAPSPSGAQSHPWWERLASRLRLRGRRTCIVLGVMRPTIWVRRDRNAHVLLRGGTWQKIGPTDGWTVQVGPWFRGTIDIDPGAGRSAALLCLMYDQDGNLLDRRTLCSLSTARGRKDFAFRPRAAAARFNLAVYFPMANSRSLARLRHLVLKRVTQS